MVPALVIEDLGTSTEIDEARILGIAEVDEADEAVVPEFSSPACSMHEASDAYMGYADQDEVTTICALREMLPRVRDGRLATDLSAMLRSHEVNIALANDASK